MSQSKEYSSNFQKAVINALKQGLEQAEVVRIFKASRQLINIWNKA